MALSTRQRQFLKGLAHSLSPVVRVGRSGLTREVVNETDRSLESHELIKARLELDESHERRQLALMLAERTGSEVVTTVGKVAVLYRAHAEAPKIRLP
ncbi:MAG: ribosome assembly RNA-binding protein YhbY [Acidobacteriota bacterium]